MIGDHEAVVNVTWHNGNETQNGDFPDPVPFDATEGDLLQWAAEAMAGGSIQGIDAVAKPDLQGFMVDRYPAKDGNPNKIFIRPKTAFG